jgi:putative ABC transport system substrate-binding protein
MSLLSNELAQKRLQLLRELLPGVTRVAILGWTVPDAASVPIDQRSTDRLVVETKAAGSRIGVDVSAHIVVAAAELPQALAQMKRDAVQAVVVQVSPLTFQHRGEIISALLRDRLPAMYDGRDFVDAGGLVTYGPDVRESYRRAAAYVDRIFKGANPGDLAIEQPTKFELVINLKTANALGLTVPQALLLRADDVIQ